MCVCPRDYFVQYSKIQWKMDFVKGALDVTSGSAYEIRQHCTTVLDMETFTCLIYAQPSLRMYLKLRFLMSKTTNTEPTLTDFASQEI